MLAEEAVRAGGCTPEEGGQVLAERMAVAEEQARAARIRVSGEEVGLEEVLALRQLSGEGVRVRLRAVRRRMVTVVQAAAAVVSVLAAWVPAFAR
jgi:hypothetical protein